MYIETAGVAFATLIATIGPFDVAAMFAAFTASHTEKARRAMAIKGALIATLILVGFALTGEVLLASLGISQAALRTAGGVLLLLIAIDMVFARDSGGTGATDDEKREARFKSDIAVFPLATPLIAGPGAMGAAVLLMADQKGDYAMQAVVVGSILLVMLLTLICLLLASKLQRLLGVTGLHVIARVMGVLLAALAVQFIFDGVLESGLIPSELV